MHIPEEEKKTSEYRFALDVVKKLRSQGYEALWAGGCVRDLLLERNPGDYDVATSARPEEVREVFGPGKTFAVGESFGVIIVRGPKDTGDIEVATFRNDGAYVDGRRPESVEFSSPEEDAQRRDFTINGIFFDPIEEEVIDFVDGLHDMREGVVRAIGNPRHRIQEDKLRMLRAVRFTATLEFDLDPLTAEAVRELAPEIHQVSEERITQEWRKMILDIHREYAIELLDSLGLMKEIFPDLINGHDSFGSHPGWNQTCSLFRHVHKHEASFEVIMALFLDSLLSPGLPDEKISDVREEIATQAENICKRMKLSNKEMETICWLLRNRSQIENSKEMSLAKLKRILSHPGFDELVVFLQIESDAEQSENSSLEYCLEFREKHSEEEINPPLLLSGDDLITMGLTPGPEFKLILDQVRDAQLNLEIQTPEEAIKLASQLASY